jgi:hypothetical protein
MELSRYYHSFPATAPSNAREAKRSERVYRTNASIISTLYRDQRSTFRCPLFTTLARGYTPVYPYLMRIILPHTHYDADHLAQVVDVMEQAGSPRIKAVWVDAYESWVALEGSHRLRAAQQLGLTPRIQRIRYSGRMLSSIRGLDIEDDMTIAEWVDRVAVESVSLDFEAAE